MQTSKFSTTYPETTAASFSIAESAVSPAAASNRSPGSTMQRKGKGLLDHLNIKRAYLMGGCMGCCPVLTFAIAYPDVALSLILFWPVGGPKYRISSRRRFTEHLTFVEQHGLQQVASLARTEGKPFGAD